MLRPSERGEGNLGCILWAVVVAILALIAWKVIPVKLNTAEFYDFMVEQAKFAANTPPDEIKKQILNKAVQLNLPVDKEKVKVERIGDRIRMSAEYTVPLNFPAGFRHDWHFRHEIDRPIFIF